MNIFEKYVNIDINKFFEIKESKALNEIDKILNELDRLSDDKNRKKEILEKLKEGGIIDES